MEKGDDCLKNTNLKITCPICYLPFNDKKRIVTLRCGHYFCDGCLKMLDENFSMINGDELEIKCSICRNISNTINLANHDLIVKFNKYIDNKIECKFDNRNNDTTESINIDDNDNYLSNLKFCKKCEKFVKLIHKNIYYNNGEDYYSCRHNKEEIVSFQDLYSIFDHITARNMSNNHEFNFIDPNAGENITRVLSILSKCLGGYKILNGNVNHILNYNDDYDIRESLLKNYFKSHAGIIAKLPDTLEKEKYHKFREIHNFKKRLKLLKNPFILQDLTSNLLNHHNLIKDQKKFIAGFIQSTKKIFTFDLSFLEVFTYEIIDLPFSFKKSHNAEFDQTTEKFFFLSEEVNNYITNIWEFSVKTNKLQAVNTYDYLLKNHRSVIIENFLFIIGGIKKKNIFKSFNKTYQNSSYVNDIDIMDKFTYKLTKGAYKLHYPRANFGLSYDNNNIYICFGEGDEGKILNSIEIIFIRNLSEMKFSSSIVKVSFDEKVCCLKNFAVMVKSNIMIMLGGEKENYQANSEIYHIDISDEFKVINKFQSKEIVAGHFTNYGIGFNTIYGFVSNHTEISDIPHVYLYSESNNKWNCHGIDIY